jgi:hypothetical protein
MERLKWYIDVSPGRAHSGGESHPWPGAGVFTGCVEARNVSFVDFALRSALG